MQEKLIQELSHRFRGPLQVAPDVAGLQIVMVNVYFVGEPRARNGSWVLIDAGLRGSAGRIAQTAEERFGKGAKPAAILLTHGHFDHIGALRELATLWDVPVYAHELEMPYLTGRSDYPPPDPTVGGGAVAQMSRFFPRYGIDLSARVRALPSDGTVPAMPGWRWIHTPGHTPGHVSLFRETDRLLIAGDAIVTVKQESALAVLTQVPVVHGPPAYFTTDWGAAGRSVQTLADLRPLVAATGHGLPMRGERMEQELQALARDFSLVAVPARGRYVRQPAVANAGGVVAVPPPVPDPMSKVLAGVGLAALAAVVATAFWRRSGGNR